MEYYEYLSSHLWNINKRRCARRWGWQCSIKGCPKRNLEFHHFKGYKHIGTEEDWQSIVPVCAMHHWWCHNTFWGKKIPLTPTELEKRYWEVYKRSWGRWRPSDVLDWVWEKIY